MAIIGGCEIPEQLYYSIEHGLWAMPNHDDDILLGLVSLRCAALGTIVGCRPRRVGTRLRLGMSCATVESAAAAEPACAPIAGLIVDVNPRLREQPQVLNRDPYGCGWLVRLRPDDWARDRLRLLTGRAALAAFAAQMAPLPRAVP